MTHFRISRVSPSTYHQWVQKWAPDRNQRNVTDMWTFILTVEIMKRKIHGSGILVYCFHFYNFHFLPDPRNSETERSKSKS